MNLLSKKAVLVCKHEMGVVTNSPSQSWVRISGAPVLVRGDPIGWAIVGCPNVGVGIYPCTEVLTATGYSSLLKIDGKPVCLDTITGITKGTPPGVVQYRVRSPGQPFVSEKP